MRWKPVNISWEGTAVEVRWLDSFRHEHIALDAKTVCRMWGLRLPRRSRWELRVFWFITQPIVVISYGRFGTTYRVHLQGSKPRVPVRNYQYSLSNIFLQTFRDNISGPIFKGRDQGSRTWPLKMGPISCPETSVRNYQYSLRNDPEERSSGACRSMVEGL